MFFSTSEAEQTIQLLRQHQTVEGQRLHVPKTLRQAIRTGGLTDLIFYQRNILPEHLLLVDRKSDSDHIRGVADLLEQRLNEANAPTIRFEYRNDPRVARRWNPYIGRHEEAVSLKELAARYGQMRVIVLSDGASLVNDLTGRIRPWLHDFESWPRRALMTPEPVGNGHSLQRALLDSGFCVASADSEGRQAVAEWFRATEGADAAGRDDVRSVAKFASYPDMLKHDPTRWLESVAPDRRTLNTLYGELRRYLGAEGLEWCAACAAFPKLHPELTLHLGATLTASDVEGRLGSESDLLRLATLPWFREGFMPDWLRLLLLGRVDKGRQALIRTALTDVLLTAREERASGLVLNISDRSSRLASRVLEKLSESDSGSPLREEIFMSFLRGRALPTLAIEAPPSLVEKVRRRLNTPDTLAWVLGFLVTGLLWLLDPWPYVVLAAELVVRLFTYVSSFALDYLAIAAVAALLVGGSVFRPNRVKQWTAAGLGFVWLLIGISLGWIGAGAVDAADQWEPMLGIIAALTGVAAWIGYQRRGQADPFERPFYWLWLNVLVLSVAVVYFDDLNIRWFGLEEKSTGLVFGVLCAWLSWLLIVVVPWTRRSIAAQALYFLGLAVATIVATIVLFDELDWKMIGREAGANGAMVSASATALAAIAIIVVRRHRMEPIERALYWLGASTALWLLPLSITITYRFSEPGIGIALVGTVPALSFALKYVEPKESTAAAVYWLWGSICLTVGVGTATQTLNAAALSVAVCLVSSMRLISSGGGWADLGTGAKIHYLLGWGIGAFIVLIWMLK